MSLTTFLLQNKAKVKKGENSTPTTLFGLVFQQKPNPFRTSIKKTDRNKNFDFNIMAL